MAAFRGVLQILRFNWPHYARATALVIAGCGMLAMVSADSGLWWILAIGILCVGFWTVTSLCVSHWVYDRSHLARWDWLREGIAKSSPTVQSWLNIHCGFDDTSRHVRRVFPHAEGLTADLYDPLEMTEPSIRRARRHSDRRSVALPATPSALPAADVATDLALLLFAAHEIRAASSREALFAELCRVLKPSGRVVVVEHARDVWNFLAYGPGCTHFYPAREWIRLGEESGLVLVKRGRITPFVHYFVWEKSA